ncbi:MAG: serine/threonine-protein kinase, partial [Myxococcota bacterium]
MDSLGRGAFGEVFRCVDEVTGHDVALKRLRPLAPLDGQRVRREICALRLLREPGVVRLLDDFEEDEAVHLVMSLVDGKPFPGAFVDGWDSLEPVVVSILETLARVHSAGVVHRDLKPANVLVDARASPVLLDFGLASGSVIGDRLTTDGEIVGTPHYLAPEQAFGAEVDGRADLYALGAMLYEALSGRVPHAGEGAIAMLHRKLT